MCVIFVVEESRPIAEEVANAFRKNPDGCGIAWRETDQDGKVIVRWEKGIWSLVKIQEYCATTPLPYVAHFRIESVGGVKPALCHPFEVSESASVVLSGKTSSSVLFHNGHWNRWKNELIDCAQRTGYCLPDGPWTDSRAMAWFTHHLGPGWADLIDEKIVLFGPEQCEVLGKGWSWHRGEFLVSNQFWTQQHVDSHVINYPRVYSESPSNGGNPGYHTTAPASLQSGTAIEKIITNTQEPVEVLPLAQAVVQHQNGRMSKTQFKRIKKYWDRKWSRPSGVVQ